LSQASIGITTSAVAVTMTPITLDRGCAAAAIEPQLDLRPIIEKELDRVQGERFLFTQR
jgi:hypothetical protein